MVDDSIKSEYIGILNYAVIALLKYKFYQDISGNLKIYEDKLFEFYNQIIKECKDLMVKKNTDYGEAWRDMRLSSLTDMILVKTFRIKNIEDNQYELIASESVDAIYMDILNYAVFSLIRISELDDKTS